MEGSAHAREIAQAFTHQAAAFEDPGRNRVFTAEAAWVFDRLELDPDALVLDVAAGTGHAARQLAPRVRAVLALDATPAMLERGHEAARRAGVGNVVFLRGDASALPFLDAGFDAVVCRFAVHHFARPGAVLAEIARCTRPAGQVVLADLTTLADAAAAAEQNRLERLRDPSHVSALDPSGLEQLLTAAGLTVVDTATRGLTRPLAPWLQQAGTPAAAAAEIRLSLQAELAGGPPTGLAPRLAIGELHFEQRFTAVTARRAEA